MAPIKSSLAKSVAKLFGVQRDRDLSLRGFTQISRTAGPFSATGGDTKRTNGSYTIHTFTTTGAATLEITGGESKDLIYVVVGGGGHGVAGSGGGGGAGGYRTGTVSGVSAGTYDVQVGSGSIVSPLGPNTGQYATIADPADVPYSNPNPYNGGTPSYINLPSPIVSQGGGNGGGSSRISEPNIVLSGRAGGSGGGGAGYPSPSPANPGGSGNTNVIDQSSPVPSQGNPGGTANGGPDINSSGGGGGGAGQAGQNAGPNNGGAGGYGVRVPTVFQDPGGWQGAPGPSGVWYCAGGGGGGYDGRGGGSPGTGGYGGGGNAGAPPGSPGGVPGTVNTGSGGGGSIAGYTPVLTGDGGPGVVMIAYLT